jgi:hypothetical protein
VIERTRHVNRIKGLLATPGVFGFEPMRKSHRKQLEQLRGWDGQTLPPRLKAELARELNRLVPAMQVGGEYIAERIIAGVLLCPDRHAYTMARAFAVAAIKDTMFQQGDGVAQTICLDVLAQGVELGAFHQREDPGVRVGRTNQWQTRHDLRLSMLLRECCASYHAATLRR